MSPAEKNYLICEKKAMAVVFASKKFRHYLLSSETFTIIMDHQAFRSVFKKGVHGRLVRWLDFLAEYRFENVYRSRTSNIPADFLSRQQLGDQMEFESTLSVTNDLKNTYEEELIDMFSLLKDIETKSFYSKTMRWVRRNIKSFVLWEDHMFRCTAFGLKAIAPIQSRQLLLKTFHNEIGYWDLETTMQFILDRFWWPNCQKEINNYVKSCDSCQRHKPIPKYRTTLHLPISTLFDTISIDFAGPFPSAATGNKFVLVTVENLTG